MKLQILGKVRERKTDLQESKQVLLVQKPKKSQQLGWRNLLYDRMAGRGATVL